MRQREKDNPELRLVITSRCTRPSQLGPKGRSDLCTSLPHPNHPARVASTSNRLWTQRGDFAVYYGIS